MIYLTESATAAVRTAIAGASGPVGGLRIMVESGGCAGYKYMMGFVETPDPTDVVIEKNGVRIYVDSASEPHIAGTTVDFVTALEGVGFAFDNPNAASKCSCGKSFG